MVKSSLARAALSAVFVLLMLASAHLLMVAVNWSEARLARPDAAHGISARLFTDRPIDEEIEAALLRTSNPAQQQVLASALQRVRAGQELQVNTLPVTPFLVAATLAITFVGMLLVWITSRLQGDAGQSIVGIFAGNLLWTGGVEYGLTIAARSLGIAKSVGVVNGSLVAIYGEYVLLKHTWGVMLLVCGYLSFLESSRCPLFLWWREHVPTMRGALVNGRIDNYGPRSAFQYATTVWASYLLLLWAYDEAVFGVHSVFTNVVMFASLAGSMYVIWRLTTLKGWGTSIRYAVGAMIVVWTPIEIAGKWGMFKAPWVMLRSSSFLIFFGGLALGTWALWHAQRRRRVVAR